MSAAVGAAESSGSGIVETVAGTSELSGNSDSQLNQPYGVAVGSDGTFYVADTNNHRVQKVDPEGAVTTVAGTTGSAGISDSQLNNPLGVAVDAAGNVYVADSFNHRIQKVDSEGTVTTVAGTAGVIGTSVNHLHYPYDIAFDDAGNLYIADSNNHRVQKVDTEGTVTAVAGITGSPGQSVNQLSYPRDVAVDSEGNVYVLDNGNSRVQKVDSEANVATVAGTTGSPGDSASQLNNPFGISVDGAGNVYVADSNNSRVQKVDTEGNVTTIAGTVGVTGATGGLLKWPNGVAVDADGDIYIADTHNQRIQKITYDNDAPTINLAGAGSSRVGGNAKATFSCVDASAITSCAATLDGDSVAAGASLTRTRGSHTLVVTAIDAAGNTATESILYVVAGKRELTGAYTGVSGTSGSIARLYMATFGRNPEATGFAFWETSHHEGMTLQQMANHFAASPEFGSLYGDTSNSEFVDLMYLNVMARTADAEGHAFWLGQLDAGMTQPRMLLMLSDSPEFKGLTYTS